MCSYKSSVAWRTVARHVHQDPFNLSINNVKQAELVFIYMLLDTKLIASFLIHKKILTC